MHVDSHTTSLILTGVEHPLLGYGTYKVGVVPASASDTNVKVGRTTAEVIKVGHERVLLSTTRNVVTITACYSPRVLARSSFALEHRDAFPPRVQ